MLQNPASEAQHGRLALESNLFSRLPFLDSRGVIMHAVLPYSPFIGLPSYLVRPQSNHVALLGTL